jgi:uncharacterized protein (TIGR03086 family)
MTDVAGTYRRRADAFAALIDGTAADRWSSPAPCAGWTARDVVAHVVDFSALVLRERVGGPSVTGPSVADDPAGAFRAAREAVQGMLDDPATPPAAVEYLDGALSFDLPQHGWDLAVATGQDATIDPRDVRYLWDTLSSLRPSWWDWHRRNGWYADPVPVLEDAPLQDRVLGLIGRDPRWRP